MLSDFLRLVKGGFVLVIGPKEAGKTSILRRLVTGEFEETKPTLGFSDQRVARVRVREIGGQKSFEKYWTVALEQKPVHIFFVIDISNAPDFDEYVTFMENYRQIFPDLGKITSLVANKLDLVNEIPKHVKNVPSIVKCSAKTGQGMLDLLEFIASFNLDTKEDNAIIEKAETEKVDNNEIVDKKRAESLLKKFDGKF